jgi:Tub family
LFCSAWQFGKVEDNVYIMDFNPTIISALQAFAMSLSTFESKMLL